MTNPTSVTETYTAIVRHNGASAPSERTIPSLESGDLLLAPEAVSLCGTDHQMLRGIRDDPSPVIGHEGACRVVGGDLRGGRWSIGQRVIVNPTHSHDPSFLLGHNIDGLFQQRVVIPRRAVDAGLVIPIGEELDSAAATLVEPLAVVDYALACLRLSAAETLVIFGDGLIGNLAARRAVDRAWKRVVLVHSAPVGAAWTRRESAEYGIVSTFAGDLGVEELVGVAACLVATHRDRTVEAVDNAFDRLGDRVVAVHLTGGVASGARADALPGVDLSAVRAANTGGPWPPSRTVVAPHGREAVVTGNRGVTQARLMRAASDLVGEASLSTGLISHVRRIPDGVDLMNRMVAQRTRVIEGELVLRLVVELNPEFVVPAR